MGVSFYLVSSLDQTHTGSLTLSSVNIVTCSVTGSGERKLTAMYSSGVELTPTLPNCIDRNRNYLYNISEKGKYIVY